MVKKSGEIQPCRRSSGKGKGRGEFCTREEKEGRKRHSKVNDAGKDEIEKKRKEQVYRGKINFRRFFF